MTPASPLTTSFNPGEVGIVWVMGGHVEGFVCGGADLSCKFGFSNLDALIPSRESAYCSTEILQSTAVIKWVYVHSHCGLCFFTVWGGNKTGGFVMKPR